MSASARRWWWLGLVLAALWLWPLATPLVDRADSSGYVAITASLVEEGDVLLLDEYEALQTWERYARSSPTGLVGCHWSLGVSLGLVPGHAAASAFAPELPVPSKAAFATMQATGLLWSLLLALLCWRLADGVSPRVRVALVAAAMLGTPLAYYTHAQMIRPHLLEALLVAAFLVLARPRGEPQGPRLDPARMMGLGALAGALLLVRPQMAAVSLVLVGPVLGDAARLRREYDPRRLRELVLAGLAFVAPVALALALSRGFAGLLYGDDRGSLAQAILSADYYPWEVLVSPHHGLLTWSPLYALAAVGLWLGLRHDRGWALGLLGFVAVQWLLNGSSYEQQVDAYHHTRHIAGGFSFGARRFVGCVPVVVLGLATAWRQAGPGARRALGVGVALCTAWCLVLTIDARPHAELLYTPATYGSLLQWFAAATGRLGEDLGWWISRSPPLPEAFMAWWIAIAQLMVVGLVGVLWARLPSALRPRVALALLLAVAAAGAWGAHRVADNTRAHAQEQAAALGALARRSQAQRPAIQRDILLEQARLRAARGEHAEARARYQAAQRLRRTRDVEAELAALPPG